MEKMMYWYNQLYLNDISENKARRLNSQIPYKRLHTDVYLVVLTSNEHSVLEIIQSRYLTQPAYPTEQMKVVGVASKKKGAFAITEQIISQTYEEMGDPTKVEEYLFTIGTFEKVGR